MLAAILLLAPAVLGAPQFGYGYGGYGGYGGVYSPQYQPLGFEGLGEAALRRRYSAPLSREESEENSEEGSDYNEDEDEDSSSEEDDSVEAGGPPPALGRLTIREPDPGFPPSQPPAGAPPPGLSAEDIPPPPPSNKILMLEEPTSEFDFKTSQVAWACKKAFDERIGRVVFGEDRADSPENCGFVQTSRSFRGGPFPSSTITYCKCDSLDVCDKPDGGMIPLALHVSQAESRCKTVHSPPAASPSFWTDSRDEGPNRVGKDGLLKPFGGSTSSEEEEDISEGDSEQSEEESVEDDDVSDDISEPLGDENGSETVEETGVDSAQISQETNEEESEEPDDNDDDDDEVNTVERKKSAKEGH